MDNVTHALAGLFLSDLAGQVRARFSGTRAASPAFRSASLGTAVLASNAPDLDFVYTGITGGKLGYLLHHRGHTHTLAAVLPLALLAVGVVVLAQRLRGRRLHGADLSWLAGVAMVGGLLHIGMDFGNNYGVHPFWPIDERWYYGDTIYIVDPWLIISLAGVALGASQTRLGRGLLLAILTLLLGIAWFSGILEPPLALLLTAYAIAWSAFMWRASVERRLAGGLISCAALAIVLSLTRQRARAQLVAALGVDPALPLVTLVSTPEPGNPFCWWLLSAQYSDTRYVARQALVSAWPGVWPTQRCHWPAQDWTAPTHAPTLPSGSGPHAALIWGPEFDAPSTELLKLVREDCVASAFSRFMRVPFWIQEGQRPLLIGDLRYDRSRAHSFAEIDLDQSPHCPPFVPPWRPPFFDAIGR